MKKIELLSPAGNFECLKAAINNGADAVYLGGSNFSARAFADNFNNDEIVNAIKYAHLRNVKVYITLNTLLNEFEIDNAYKQAKYYYDNNVDALLVQDLGLFYRLRKDFPDFELHASTQMHIHNLSGVKTAKKLGFKRVVLARESSLELIKECSKEEIEVECFVHGAICVSYSGQCLMSSITKNRSANKGMCAQCCRLKYKLLENGKEILTDTDYLLSPKDMCLLDDIPKLIEAGVSSLKIEGRMKSPAYVGYVTRCYREAIDAYYSDKQYKINDQILTNLKLLYNRGFTNSYLLNDNQDIFSNVRPNHMGIEIGKVIKTSNSSCFVKLSKQINQFDGIRFISNNDSGLILNMLKVDGLLTNAAYPGQIVEISVKEPVHINDIVVKTLDYNLEKTILSKEDKTIPIDLSINIKLNDFIKIEAKVNNLTYVYVSKIKPFEAINKPVSKENIIDSFNKVDKHPYKLNNISIDLDDCFIPLKSLNVVRREFYDCLDDFILSSFKREENDPLVLNDIYEFNQNIELFEKDFVINPVINTQSKYISNFVSEFGGLCLNGDKNGYYTLNTSNSYAFEFLLRLGFKNVILSSELSKQQTDELFNNFKLRTNSNVKPYVLSKGKRTLMYLNRNPFDKYVKNNDNLTISDGFNSYDIKYNHNFLEIIENNDDNIDFDTKCLKYYKS